MKIIVLAGPNSCGKTTSLNIVYNLLIAQGCTSTNRQQLGSNPQDFSDIVNWNGKRISIFTMGDYSGDLIKAVDDYAKQNCDVMICACNTRLVKPFKSFAQYNMRRVDTAVEHNPSLRNAKDNNNAQNILNAIQ
jgi:hypothetical protein